MRVSLLDTMEKESNVHRILDQVFVEDLYTSLYIHDSL